MGYEEKRKWLESYQTLQDHIIYLDNRMKGIKAISYDPVEERGGKGKTPIDLIQERIETENKMREIEDTIDNIENKHIRMVLGYRYLMMKTIEQIEEIMKKSDRWIKNRTKEGIKKISE